jgi:uncharacterized protein YbjT (DUF2867 family)
LDALGLCELLASRDPARYRATRRDRRPPRGEEIERGLRERAVHDPRAAEILLRWMHRPRPLAPEDDALEALSVEQLERLHAGLMRLCSMDPGEQARIVRRLLDDDGVALSDEER